METKYSVTRRLQFCAGHRVHKHESKCNNMHGHNYVLLIDARPRRGLDDRGRVIDFSEIKDRVKTWIDQNWDHGFIYFADDVHVENSLRQMPNQKMFALDSNPTAENMAAYLLNDVCPRLFADTDVEVHRITLWETENCYAEVSLA